MILALCAAPFAASAVSWQCEYDNNVREVYIERAASSPVPCKVIYRKPTEGLEDQVVWNAEHETNYCDEKAKGFIAKLESYGWLCSETMRGDEGAISDGDNTEGEGTVDSNTGEDSDKGENAAGS